MKNTCKQDAVAVEAARLFKEEKLSYTEIGARLGLDKKHAKSKVWAGLGTHKPKVTA